MGGLSAVTPGRAHTFSTSVVTTPRRDAGGGGGGDGGGGGIPPSNATPRSSDGSMMVTLLAATQSPPAVRNQLCPFTRPLDGRLTGDVAGEHLWRNRDFGRRLAPMQDRGVSAVIPIAVRRQLDALLAAPRERHRRAEQPQLDRFTVAGVEIGRCADLRLISGGGGARAHRSRCFHRRAQRPRAGGWEISWDDRLLLGNRAKLIGRDHTMPCADRQASEAQRAGRRATAFGQMGRS